MKTYEIKITGTGTLEEIKTALEKLAAALPNMQGNFTFYDEAADLEIEIRETK